MEGEPHVPFWSAPEITPGVQSGWTPNYGDLPTIDLGGVRLADLRDRYEGGYSVRNVSKISSYSIHHSATATPAEDLDIAGERAILDRIDQFHRTDPDHLWPHISYHVAVFPSGRVYYLGGVETMRWVVKGQNDRLIGICLIGTFMDERPGSLQLWAARQAVIAMDAETGRAPELRPHRAYNGDTACPGNTWESWLPVIQRLPDGQSGPFLNAEIARCVRWADMLGIPREAALTLGIGETNLDPNARRPRNPEQDEAFWPDVSAGLYQQTAAFSDEIQERGISPARYPGPETVASLLDRYWCPDYATEVALDKLAGYLAEEGGNPVNAACRYNRPRQDPAWNPANRRYTEALAYARDILAALP